MNEYASCHGSQWLKQKCISAGLQGYKSADDAEVWSLPCTNRCANNAKVQSLPCTGSKLANSPKYGYGAARQNSAFIRQEWIHRETG
jgi:hypothetical protein